MPIVKYLISELVQNRINPRIIKDKQFKNLQRSLKEDPKFLDARPIVLNTRTNTVVCGNQRLEAARALGWTEVPVFAEELTEEEEKRWMVKDNLHSGEWDFNSLAENFDVGFLHEMGFDEKEIAKVQNKQERSDDDFDIDTAVEAAPDYGISHGDVFALGEHRVICGDSTAALTYEKLLGDMKANMVFTDPPYNIGYEGGMNTHGQNKRDKIQNDKMPKEEFRQFLSDFIRNSMRYSEGAWYVCMSSQELDTLKMAFEDNGGHWQSFIIWAKNTFTLSRSDWQNQYEPILYGWNSDAKKHFYIGWRDEGNIWKPISDVTPVFQDGKTILRIGDTEIEIDGDATKGRIRRVDEADVWNFKRPTRSPLHPTMKPVELVEKAIQASSVLNDVVLDPFLGSGTTLIAAENVGRRCFGIEYEPKYIHAILRRWEQKTGKTAVKVNV